MVLEGYSDVNWISYVDEMKATSEYVFTLGGGVVSWKSCKQTILTKSKKGIITHSIRQFLYRRRMSS